MPRRVSRSEGEEDSRVAVMHVGNQSLGREQHEAQHQQQRRQAAKPLEPGREHLLQAIRPETHRLRRSARMVDAQDAIELTIHEHQFTRSDKLMPRPKTMQESQDQCEVRCVNGRKVQQMRKLMKPAPAVVSLAETFKVLGDPTRLRIAYALSRDELCVCDLAAVLGVSQSVVSHSLRALRQMRLVRYRKQGKIAYYALDDDHIGSLVAEGFRHVDELSLPRAAARQA